MRVHNPFKYLVVLAILAGSSTAQAGGMFFGVRCGAGATAAEAAVALNAKLDRLDGYAGTYHRGLALMTAKEGVLACVLVNRKGQNGSNETDKANIQCLSRTFAQLADDADGFYFEGEQRGELSSLSLVQEADGKISACALAEPLIKTTAANP